MSIIAHAFRTDTGPIFQAASVPLRPYLGSCTCSLEHCRSTSPKSMSNDGPVLRAHVFCLPGNKTRRSSHFVDAIGIVIVDKTMGTWEKPLGREEYHSTRNGTRESVIEKTNRCYAINKGGIYPSLPVEFFGSRSRCSSRWTSPRLGYTNKQQGLRATD